MNEPIPVPAAITVALDAYERRRRLLRLARGAGEAALAGAGAVVAVAATDQWLHPGPGVRAILAAGCWVAGAGTLAWRGLVPFLARRDPVATARAIEAMAGGALAERLSSALELAARPPAGTSAWMIGRTVALAAQDAAGLDGAALVPSHAARRALLAAGACAAVLGAACLVPSLRALALRAVWPFATVARPSSYDLVVRPGDATVPQGGRFALDAAIRPDPGQGDAELVWDDGVVERLALQRSAPGRYELQLPAVTQGFRYRVLAGDAESPTHRVLVSPPPLLSGIGLRIRPPAYTGLPPRSEAGGDAEIVAGSTVAVEASFSGVPVSSAALLRDGQGELALHLGDGGANGAVELRPEASLSFGLRLIGGNGLVAELPQRWLLTVRADAPPTAALAGDGVEAGLVGADEAVTVTATGDDDLGLRRLDLVIGDDAGELARRPLLAAGDAAGPRSLTRHEAIDLDGFGLGAGDRITLRLDAEDLGGQQASAKPLELAVVAGDPARAAAWAAQLRRQLGELDKQLDALRQAEKGWSGLARSHRPEDPTAQRGEVVLLGSRLAEAVERVSTVAAEVRRQALASALASAPRVQAVADDLVVWSAVQGDVFSAATAAAREPAAAAEALTRSRDLTESAHSGLVALRQDFGLVVARLEGEGLVGACDAAKSRADRAGGLLRGFFAWSGQDTQPGLALTVFANQTLDGEPLKRAHAAVDAAAAAMPDRAEDWSARWEGQIQAAAEGDYEFVTLSDDGVRLRVAGQELLPGAWIGQGATEYRGRIHLAPGWHDIVVEYFQGGGPFALTLAYGVVGGAPRAVDLGCTRARAAGVDPALAMAMADASPASAARARLRLAGACLTVAGVPDAIARMADDSGREGLMKLANDAREGAKASAAIAARPEAIAAGELKPITQRIDALRRAASEALKALDQAVARERLKPDGPLGAERGIAAELRQRAAALRQLPAALPAADREAALRREAAAARATADSLESRLERRRAELVERASASAATLTERADALLARETLASEVAAAQRQLGGALAQPPGDANAFADRLELGARELERTLAEAARRVDLADRAAARSAANDLRRHAAAATVAERGGDLARADRERAAVAAIAAAAAADLRERGENTAASAVDRAQSLGEAERVAQAIEREGGRDREPSHLDELAATQLARVSADLQQGPPSRADGADLAAAARALALEAERRRRDGSEAGRESARAFANLAADAARVARVQPDPSAVADLARRAERLRADEAEARRGEAAAAEARGLSETGRSTSLAAAAERAASEAGAKTRAAVTAQLAEAAGDAATPAPPSSAEREARAERLSELADRDGALAAQEAAARAEFAKAEQVAAQATREAVTAAAAAAQAAAATPGAGDGLAKALETVAGQLPAQAAAAAARAERAAAPAPSAAAGDPAASASLSASAAASAAELDHAIARPLALASRASGDDGARQQAAAVGARLADLADAQVRAAERLDRVLERRESTRAALAQELASGDDSAAASPVPADALAAAGAAQAAARQAAAAAAAAEAAAARAESDPGQATAAAQARAAAVAANGEALAAAQRAAAAAPGTAPAVRARAVAALGSAARGGRALAGELAASDSAAAGEAGGQAATAHAALAAATAELGDAARTAAAALRSSPPSAAAAPATAMQAAAAEALAGVRAAPDSAASWRHAADVLSAVAAGEAVGRSDGTLPATGQPQPGGMPGAMPGLPAGQPGGSSTTAQASGQGDPGDAKGLEERARAIDQAEWGRSRGDLRGDLMAGGVESFSEEHQEAIRAYFQRVGSDR